MVSPVNQCHLGYCGDTTFLVSTDGNNPTLRLECTTHSTELGCQQVQVSTIASTCSRTYRHPPCQPNRGLILDLPSQALHGHLKTWLSAIVRNSGHALTTTEQLCTWPSPVQECPLIFPGNTAHGDRDAQGHRNPFCTCKILQNPM